MSVKPNKTFIKQRKRIIITLISILLALILIYDLSGIGGNIRFYSKWVECGQKPVRVYGSDYMNSKTPSYAPTPTFSTARMAWTYFCTPLEAERAGFSAVNYDKSFPELDKIGEQPPDRIDWDR